METDNPGLIKRNIHSNEKTVDDNSSEYRCMICLEYDDPFLKVCKAGGNCNMRAHEKCISDYVQKQRKPLACPCGSNYGDYISPRKSITMKSYSYALISAILLSDWTETKWRKIYPIKTSIITTILFCTSYFAISQKLALALFFLPLFFLIILFYIVSALKINAIKYRVTDIFDWWRGPADSQSALENIVETMYVEGIISVNQQDLNDLVEEIKEINNRIGFMNPFGSQSNGLGLMNTFINIQRPDSRMDISRIINTILIRNQVIFSDDASPESINDDYSNTNNSTESNNTTVSPNNPSPNEYLHNNVLSEDIANTLSDINIAEYSENDE